MVIEESFRKKELNSCRKLPIRLQITGIVINGRFEQVTENHTSRAARPRLVARRLDDDFHIAGQTGKGVLRDGLAHGVQPPLSRVHPFTTDDDQLRIQEVDEGGDANTQPATGFSQQLTRKVITSISRLNDVVYGE